MIGRGRSSETGSPGVGLHAGLLLVVASVCHAEDAMHASATEVAEEILVVGARESEEKTVAMRRLGGKNQEILALNEAVDRLTAEAKSPVHHA